MGRMKLLLLAFVVFCAFNLSQSSAVASVVTVASSGEVEVNVLGVEHGGEMEITKIASEEGGKDHVILEKVGQKVSLIVNNGQDQRELDVASITDTVIEIEERPNVNKVKIGISGDHFVINESGYKVSTQFPITVDAPSGKISIKTGSGDHYISILPSEAVKSLVRSKTLTHLEGTGEIALREGEMGELLYDIPGEKVVDLFGFYSYPVPVTASVSVSNGNITQIDQPPWLRVLRIIFV